MKLSVRAYEELLEYIDRSGGLPNWISDDDSIELVQDDDDQAGGVPGAQAKRRRGAGPWH